MHFNFNHVALGMNGWGTWKYLSLAFFRSFISIPKSHKQKVETEGTKSTQITFCQKERGKKKRKYYSIIKYNHLKWMWIYVQLLKIIIRRTWHSSITASHERTERSSSSSSSRHHHPQNALKPSNISFVQVLSCNNYMKTESIGLHEIIKKLLLRLQRQNNETSG